MDYNLIINQILTLFLIILTGYILRKKEHINEEINRGLSTILINISLPALIITSMNVKINPNLVSNMKIIFLISVILYIIVILFTNLLTKFLSLSPARKTVFMFLLIFGNVGYMGYPVLNTIYPESGILYGIFNNIIFSILLWTYGIYLFTSNQDDSGQIKWKKLINPGTIAISIGFCLLLTPIELPLIVNGALEKLAAMTFPLAMLIIGSSLANVKFKNIFSDRLLLSACLLKLVIIPLLIFVIFKQFPIPEKLANISIILSGMPAAASSVIFAEKFDGDHRFAAEGVFLTTLLSLFTIPLFIYLIYL